MPHSVGTNNENLKERKEKRLNQLLDAVRSSISIVSFNGNWHRGEKDQQN